MMALGAGSLVDGRGSATILGGNLFPKSINTLLLFFLLLLLLPFLLLLLLLLLLLPFMLLLLLLLLLRNRWPSLPQRPSG